MRLPVSSLAGVAVIVIYCVFTFSSLALYSGTYSPVTNWLSDLGNSSPTYNPRGAILYNLGCVLTGVGLFPFFIGLYKWYTEEKWRRISLLVCQVVGCLAAFALIMVGIFSENSGSLHRLWSEAFFLLNFLVLILVGVSLFTHPRYLRAIAYYGFMVAAVNLALIFAPSMPLLEWFTVFTALGYVGLMACNMAKKSALVRKS
jgi:hypothetical membrane protein